AGWREWLAEIGFMPSEFPDGPTFTDGGLCLDAAISGQGVFMAWETLASDALARGQLVAPLPGRAMTGDSYWFVTTKDMRCKPTIPRFRNWLCADLSKAAREWPV